MTSLDAFYRVPKEDHRYRIKETPIITANNNESSYINQVIKRAKSIVDPRKYSKVIDWRVRSSSQLLGLTTRTKRVTDIDELMMAKKKIPGPSVYKSVWIRPKTYGFYDNSSPKISVFQETIYEKKRIPCSNQYNTFKGLFKTLNERNRKLPSTISLDIKRKDYPTFKLKKNSKPGPTTYESTKSLEKCVLSAYNYVGPLLPTSMIQENIVLMIEECQNN